MNDYKELIARAKHYDCLIHSPIVKETYFAMIDAIEQLAKERDAAVEDLHKARVYLDWLIEEAEK